MLLRFGSPPGAKVENKRNELETSENRCQKGPQKSCFWFKKQSLAEKPLLPPRLLHEVVLQSRQTAATQHLAGRLGIAH